MIDPHTEFALAEFGYFRIGDVPDDRAVPVVRVIGSMREWLTGQISDRDFCRSLRKAAFEVQHGN